MESPSRGSHSKGTWFDRANQLCEASCEELTDFSGAGNIGSPEIRIDILDGSFIGARTLGAPHEFRVVAVGDDAARGGKAMNAEIDAAEHGVQALRLCRHLDDRRYMGAGISPQLWDFSCEPAEKGLSAQSDPPEREHGSI